MREPGAGIEGNPAAWARAGVEAYQLLVETESLCDLGCSRRQRGDQDDDVRSARSRLAAT
jgi:hypothetical protein